MLKDASRGCLRHVMQVQDASGRIQLGATQVPTSASQLKQLVAGQNGARKEICDSFEQKY